MALNRESLLKEDGGKGDAVILYGKRKRLTCTYLSFERNGIQKISTVFNRFDLLQVFGLVIFCLEIEFVEE